MRTDQKSDLVLSVDDGRLFLLSYPPLSYIIVTRYNETITAYQTN